MAYQIYDLDGTVIDSAHRYRNKPCGSIDLDYWRENCTPDKIALDKLLPLAHKMRRHYYSGYHVIICTSRILTQSCYDFLDKHKLFSHAILSRPEGCNDSDADLKEYALDEYFDGLGEIGLDSVRAVMYEDNWTVVERLRSRGVLCCYVGE